MAKRKWRTSEIILISVIATPFLVMIYGGITSPAYEADMEKRAESFQPATCTIKSASYKEFRSLPSRKDPHPTISYDFHAEYTYSVNGREYTSVRIKPTHSGSRALPEAEAFVNRHAVGSTVPCYYDPAEPSFAFLYRK